MSVVLYNQQLSDARKISHNSASDKRSDQEKLDNLAASGTRVYSRVQTVFPFQLFPVTVVVDENKIDIIRTQFFMSHKVFTVLLADIATVKISNDLFFATIEFEVAGYEQNPESINYLPKKQAYKTHQTIIGLLAAIRENIALDTLPAKQVRRKIRLIGQTNVDEIDQIS